MDKVITFESGLTLAVSPMPNTRSLSIGVFVETGSMNETAENSGISHLIEHMVFKGTTSRSAFDIADEMESIGASINAFTSKNMTAYYTVSTDEYAKECLDILSDIYLNATFTDENLQREKGVIVEEINMTEDSGEDLCFELLAKAHFKDNPLARPILGTAQTVNGTDYQMIKDYMSKYYTADNTYIILTGNIDAPLAQKLVKECFEGKIKKTGEKSIQLEPAVLASEYICKDKAIEQANIAFSFPCIPVTHPKRKALLLLNNIIGGGMSSRLFQEVREKLGLVYSVYTQPIQYKHDGYYVLYLGTSPDYVEQALGAIKKVITELKKDGITEQEFRKGKAQFKSKTVLGAESSVAIMRTNGRNLIMGDKLFNLEDELAQIEQVTLQDTRELIDLIFDMNKVSASCVGKNVTADLLGVLQG